jgi:hypothetical protein
LKAEAEPRPLAAVFVLNRIPENDPGDSIQLLRLSPARALAAVLAHAYCFSLRDFNRKRRMMKQYMDLVTQARVFEIRFRAGFERLPEILDRMERAVADD